MQCDLCGNSGDLYQTKIDGAVMTVCNGCKEYGDVVKKLPTAAELKAEEKRAKYEVHTPTSFERKARFRPVSNAETMLLVRNDYGPHIKNGREKLGLKQEELAKKLRIKESQLHKYESGGKKPDLETARMLEGALRVTLVQEHVEEHGTHAGPKASGPLTIADMIKTRKR